MYYVPSPPGYSIIMTFISGIIMLCSQARHFTLTQGSHPVSQSIFQYFSRIFQGLRLIFQDSKIHINPFTPKISILFLLIVCTFLIMSVLRIQLFFEFNRFQKLSRTGSLFPGQSATIKFQDFPGPIRTLLTACSYLHKGV